uniref:Uncharacterized protein n=1 Tax=Meloidogyne floridensis TaxID=298350 RepID=A0A915NPW9_9BILA
MLVIFGFVLFYLAEIQVGIQAMKNTNKDEDKIQDAQQSRPLPTFEDRPPPSEEKKSSKKPSPLPLPAERAIYHDHSSNKGSKTKH